MSIARQPLVSVENTLVHHSKVATRNGSKSDKQKFLKNGEMEIVLVKISKIVMECVSGSQPEVADSILKLIHQAISLNNGIDSRADGSNNISKGKEENLLVPLLHEESKATPVGKKRRLLKADTNIATSSNTIIETPSNELLLQSVHTEKERKASVEVACAEEEDATDFYSRSGLMHWDESIESNETVKLAEDPSPSQKIHGESSSEAKQSIHHSSLPSISKMEEKLETDDHQTIESYDCSTFGEEGIIHWEMTDFNPMEKPLLVEDDSTNILTSQKVKTSKPKKKETARRRLSCRPQSLLIQSIEAAKDSEPQKESIGEASAEGQKDSSIIQPHFPVVAEDPFFEGVLHWECESEMTFKDNALNGITPPQDEGTAEEPMNDEKVMVMLLEQEDLKSFPASASKDISVLASASRGRSRRRASLSAECFIKSLSTASHRGSPQAAATLAAISKATAEDLALEGETEIEPSINVKKRQRKAKATIKSGSSTKQSGMENLNNKVSTRPETKMLLRNDFDSVNRLGFSSIEIPNQLLSQLSDNNSILSDAKNLVERLFSQWKLGAFGLALVNDVILLSIAIIALLSKINEKEVEDILLLIVSVCKLPENDEKIIKYSNIEKASLSMKGSSLLFKSDSTSSTSSSSQSTNKIKKSVRFNSFDGSAVDPPNDRRLFSWASLLLTAKKLHFVSSSISELLNTNKGLAECERTLALLCSILSFLSSENNAEALTHHLLLSSLNTFTASPSTSELKTTASFLLTEILFQLTSKRGETAYSAANNVKAYLRQRSTWMLSAVIRYQLRWSLDLPPPCISAFNSEGSSSTGDLYATYRSGLHAFIEICQPFSEEALKASPVYGMEEIVTALECPGLPKTMKYLCFVEAVTTSFAAQPFANLSCLFAEALRQITEMLTIISRHCEEGEEFVHDSLVDYCSRLRKDSSNCANVLSSVIKNSENEKSFSICQV